VDELLDRRAVDLEHLIELVDRRVGGDRGVQRAPGGLQLRGLCDVLAQLEQRSGRRSLGGGRRLLAQQRRCRPRRRPPSWSPSCSSRQVHGVPRCRHVTQPVFPGHDQPCQTWPEPSRRCADPGQPGTPERTRRLRTGRQAGMASRRSRWKAPGRTRAQARRAPAGRSSQGRFDGRPG
jgi:hypothetical protein